MVMINFFDFLKFSVMDRTILFFPDRSMGMPPSRFSSHLNGHLNMVCFPIQCVGILNLKTINKKNTKSQLDECGEAIRTNFFISGIFPVAFHPMIKSEKVANP